MPTAKNWEELDISRSLRSPSDTRFTPLWSSEQDNFKAPDGAFYYFEGGDENRAQEGEEDRINYDDREQAGENLEQQDEENRINYRDLERDDEEGEEGGQSSAERRQPAEGGYVERLDDDDEEKQTILDPDEKRAATLPGRRRW